MNDISRVEEKLRILVVDDERDTADSMTAVLSLMGYSARPVYDGSAALAAAHESKPDVVLIDLAMPRMNGCELARQIRLEPGMQDVTLVAITGYESETVEKHSEACGFAYHLVKPVHAEEIRAILQSLEQPATSSGAESNAADR
jgi:CheY-like chemotaxis protein